MADRECCNRSIPTNRPYSEVPIFRTYWLYNGEYSRHANMSHTDYKIVTVITLMKEQILYSTCKGENRTVK